MTEPTRSPEMAPVFEALPGHYALLSPTGEFAVLAISAVLLDSLGLQRDQALGQPLCELLAAGGDSAADGLRMLHASLETVRAGRESDCLPTLRIDCCATGHASEQYWVFHNQAVTDAHGRLSAIVVHAENVTVQLQVQRARRAAESLNRQILDSARDFAIVGTDLDGRITRWNDGARRVLGWSEEEMRGQPIDAFFTPEDLAHGRPAIEMRLSLQNGYATDERWHLRRDGSRFWANGQMTPLRDDAGTPIGFVKMLRDQTEQHLTAQALEESRHRLDSALDTGLIGFFEWDVVDARIFGDERFAALHGVPAQQAVAGMPLATLGERIHPQDRASLRRCLDTALQTHADYTREFRVQADGDTPRWVLVRARCYLQDGDKPLRYTGAAIDISASKLAEAEVRKLNARLEALVRERTSALRMREAQMRAIFETSLQFQVLLSPDGIVVDANPVSLQAIATRLEDVAGQPLADAPWFAASPAARDAVAAGIAQAALGAAMRRELDLNLPDGERCFDFALRPIRAGGGEVVGIIAEANDTTGRRRAEEQLRQSQKMEAIGQLTGGIAHDFNNLLAGIMGSLDLLRLKFEAGQSADHGRYIGMATAAAQRAAALTQRLLAFSRRQTLDLQPVDANALVAGMADLLRRTLERNIALSLQLAPASWLAHTDANQLENALLNLAINARDAMPDGGTLTIATRNVTLDEDHVRARPELRPGDYLMLSVSDTGSGMSEEVKGKAFDPFFTTKPIGQGTGLGLSMIYGYVRQSSGHVTIHSSPGQGTTVTLYLPRNHADAPAADAQTASAPPLPGKGERILLVEDEAAMRAIMVETLTRLGYRVEQAGDAAAALECIAAHDAPDLLITDVGLPGLNGRQLAEQARRLRPGIRVLFISGYAGALVKDEFLADGMDMIGKPFALDGFAIKVRAMLD